MAQQKEQIGVRLFKHKTIYSGKDRFLGLVSCESCFMHMTIEEWPAHWRTASHRRNVRFRREEAD